MPCEVLSDVGGAKNEPRHGAVVQVVSVHTIGQEADCDSVEAIGQEAELQGGRQDARRGESVAQKSADIITRAFLY